MNIYIFCGKGGVGKTNSTVSFGLYLSAIGAKCGIIDYDGGHSVKNTLGMADEWEPNVIHEVRLNLSIAIVENSAYVGIADSQAKRQPLKDYLNQFPEDLGLIPLADMVNAFFGVPTDIPTLQKFMTLVRMLREFEKGDFQNVIIDVEPTAGLERLLSNAQSTVRSLLNLKNQGIISLAFVGAKWPDIAGYLKGDYIKNADRYSANIAQTATLIKRATYIIVATPEASPVNQAFEVKKIIEKFGGTVQGYVINNLRDEPHELENVARLEKEMLPVVKIKRQTGLHVYSQDRKLILMKIGEAIAAELYNG